MNHQHDDAKLLKLLKMLLQTLQITQTKLLDSFCLGGMGRDDTDEWCRLEQKPETLIDVKFNIKCILAADSADTHSYLLIRK